MLKDIKDILYEGKANDDIFIINTINRIIIIEDLINENIVIDGFPYNLSQAILLPDTLIPDLIFVAKCNIQERIKKMYGSKRFWLNSRNSSTRGIHN